MGDGEGYLVADGGHYLWVDEMLTVRRGPDVLVQTILLNLGQSVDLGRVVTSTTPGWRALRQEVVADPTLLTRLPTWPRKFEEFVAGGYVHARWRDVILSPRSGDRGFDVAAYKRGRQVLDELKAFKPSLRVGHQVVRAALGLLVQHDDVDQVRVTTTSTFAPRILQAFADQLHRELELRDRDCLLRWLRSMRPTCAILDC